MIIAANTMPVAGNPAALSEFRAAMARYAPGVSRVDGQVEARAAGEVLRVGAAPLPDADTTALRKALLWLDAIRHGYDLGITTPLEFSPGKPATPVVCWFNETIHNHRFVPTNGEQPTWAPHHRSRVS
jgi:hypothetical protein